MCSMLYDRLRPLRNERSAFDFKICASQQKDLAVGHAVSMNVALGLNLKGMFRRGVKARGMLISDELKLFQRRCVNFRQLSEDLSVEITSIGRMVL
mmetsp:Transcript_36163/g.70294  ORF Transcript_36163/g.70294 Transcript_36163/m.70294 type:complete len:96 (+) Transcript_36163:137-424(+)